MTKDSAERPTNTFRPIADRFTNIRQVQTAVRQAGLESSNLILGVDFTKSNTWTGAETFAGRCLHCTQGPLNPYQRVIDVMGRTLEEFDDDRLIPAFGFGDATTGDQACFPFASGGPIHGVAAVLERYNEVANQVVLAGPTSFAPVIRQAIQIVREERAYHILVIIADGQVTDASPNGETARAIIEASDYPLSIVVVGVGDGPWDAMEVYDDELPQRRFDNFQFVDFNKIKPGPAADAQFALHALMEIPDQYKFIKENGLLSSPAFNRPMTRPPTRLARAPPSRRTPSPPRQPTELRASAPTRSTEQLQHLPRLAVQESPPSPCEIRHSKLDPNSMPAPPEYSSVEAYRSARHLASPPAAEWY